MIEQSAQTLSFTSTSGSEEKTAVLKSNSLYTGLRITLKYWDNSASAYAFNPLAFVNKLVVNVPEYGSNSRRVDLADNTMSLLPLVCQLGALGSSDAAAAASVPSTDPVGVITGQAGYCQFDIPINKKNLDEDIRVNIGSVAVDAASDILTVEFAFVDYPLRNVFFKTYDEGSISSYQRWFPADGNLQGLAVIAYSAAWAESAGANAFTFDTRTNALAQMAKISLNGEQAYTFDNPEVLGAALDEIVGGGAQGTTESWSSYGSYGMFKNFPAQSGASYVNVDLASGVTDSYLTLGVMTDV